MTEETKERYNEDRIHFEVIREIIKEEVKPIAQRQTWFYTAAFGCLAFFYVELMKLSKDIDTKPDKIEVDGKFDKADKTYMEKWDYYQIEVDEHRVMKEILKNPIQADYLFDVINDNIEVKLIGKFTTRGGEK